MGVARGRVAIVLLLLAVALPMASLAQRGGEEGPVPDRQTTCWDCHVNWPAGALRTFFTIIPPAEAGAEVGQPFDFIVQLENTWNPAGNGPSIEYYEPILDLRNAPSLGFYVDSPPVSAQLSGQTQPGDSPVQPASGFVVQQIPLGTSQLTITLTPQDQNTVTGPDMVLNVYAGVQQPTGSPSLSVDVGGRGQAETLQLDGAEQFLSLGYGNWTLEAVAKGVDPANPLGLVGPPNVQPQPFTVDVQALVEDTGERQQPQPIRERINKGSSALIKYRLIANAVPGPTENVSLTINGTVFYEHLPASSPDDYANVTKSLASPIPVTFEDPRVLLRTEADETTRVPPPFNGASIITISEAIGYGSAFLLVSSVWTGGMFGKASRRQLNNVFGSAKRRVAFHNFLSYGIMLFAAIHTVLFVVPAIEPSNHWSLGIIWGGIALLSMLLLGVTGAFQVQMIRKWNYNTWRWSHYGLAIGAILFTIVHMLLDGVHFGEVAEAVGWSNPLDPRRA